MQLRALLFDLDGTLVQTREASWALFQQTNSKFNIGIDDREAFFALFKDNFFAALTKACANGDVAKAAIDHFMELLKREYRPAFVPGMVDVIHALAQHCVLCVLSTNSLEIIRTLTENEGVSECFAHIFSGDVEPDKRVSIRMFMGNASYATPRAGVRWYDGAEASRALQADEVAVVTDTVGDVLCARECGVRAIGVAWGMHDESKLLQAGAERVARWPQELLAWVTPNANHGLSNGQNSGRHDGTSLCEAARQTSSNEFELNARPTRSNSHKNVQRQKSKVRRAKERGQTKNDLGEKK